MSRLPADNLGFLLERLRTPVQNEGRLPNTDGVAGLPKDARRTAEDVARFFWDQQQRALNMRRPHATSWMKVLSILSGIHYFKINEHGMWQPLRKHDERQIRAVVPLLKPRLRREHGRISSNQIGITAAPITGASPSAFYNAQVAQDSLTHWIEETNLPGVESAANMQLLVYGGYCYYAEKNRQKKQVYARTYPFCDLLPIPYDARDWEEMDGVQRVTMMTEAWLEQQDEMYERRNGVKPPKPMSKMSGSQFARPSVDWTGFGSSIDWYSRFRGARVAWIWMKPTEANGWKGEHAFMVENELFAFVSGKDSDGVDIVTPRGDLPLYPVTYFKSPHDWWPNGFAEDLVSLQREQNRQMTNILEAAQLNRGFLAYDQTLIDRNNIQDSITGLVPFDAPGPENRGDVIKHVPPAPIGREFGALLQVVDRFADLSAGHESGIISGESEGRVDGGPAVNQLNANAQAPIIPVLDSKWQALRRLYPEVLDGIREVWPAEKKIKVLGANNVARETLVTRDRIPGSDDVVLSPTPLIVNGRMGMLNLILQLRNIPTEEGPLISTREVRRSLQMLNLAPPGMTVFDKTEQRIMYRIGMLIGNGAQPMTAPADSDQLVAQVMQLENHNMAIELIREVILDPSFMLYSQQVQEGLRRELQFHMNMLQGVVRTVDNFDDEAQRNDMLQMENEIEAKEQDPTSLAGIFSPTGYPL